VGRSLLPRSLRGAGAHELEGAIQDLGATDLITDDQSDVLPHQDAQ